MLDELWTAYKTLHARSSGEAEAFYRQHLWPELLARWQGKNASPSSFAVSIHTLGDSPEVVALAASRLRAENVVVLYSERTKEHLRWLEKQLGYRVDGAEVQASDTVDIYREVQRVAKQYAGRPLAFDSTGGTKAMVAGLSAAAFTLSGRGFDVRVFYIDVRRERGDLPRPIPGTEQLVELGNPLRMFGDLDFENAKVRFFAGDFEGASRTFAEIAERTGEAGRYQPYSLLAKGYAHWYANNFSEAQEQLRHLVDFLAKPGLHDHALKQHVGMLRRQEQGLGTLVPLAEAYADPVRRIAKLADTETANWLLASIEQMQRLYARAGNHTAAGLLCYRGLEVASQHRLATYGFDTLSADYSVLPPAEDALAIAYADAWRKIGSKTQARTARGLPSAGQPVPLLEGFMLLTALGDASTETINYSRLMGLSELRNSSLWTHGYKPIAPKEYRNLSGLFGDVSAMLRKLAGGDYSAEPPGF